MKITLELTDDQIKKIFSGALLHGYDRDTRPGSRLVPVTNKQITEAVQFMVNLIWTAQPEKEQQL